MDTPVQPGSQFAPQMDAPVATRNSPGDMGVGNDSLKSRLLPPVVLPKYYIIAQIVTNVVIDYQK